MFTLACPSCQTALSLDDGYRGMTCRCSACTSLIAIPHDPATQPPQVIRAGRPESPTRPATPQHSGYAQQPPHQSGFQPGMPHPQQPQHLQPGQPGYPPQPGMQPPGFNPANPGQSGYAPQPPHGSSYAGTPPHVAAAPAGGPALVSIKRGNDTAARSSGLSKNALLIGALATPAALVLILLVVFLVVKSGPDPAVAVDGDSSVIRQTGGDDPVAQADNLQLGPSPDNRLVSARNKPSVIGLPLARHTTIFVDAGDTARPWFGLFQESLNETLSRDSSARVSLVYLTDGKVVLPPRQQIRPGRLLGAAVREMDRRVTPAGGRNFWAGLEAAVDTDAEHIVMVTARTKWDRSVDKLRAILKSSDKSVSFDVVSFGGANRTLEQIAKDFNGVLQDVDLDDLRRWIRELSNG